MRIVEFAPPPVKRDDPDYPLLDGLIELRGKMAALYVHTWNLTGHDILDRLGGTSLALLDRYIAEYCASLGIPMPPLESISKRTLENPHG